MFGFSTKIFSVLWKHIYLMKFSTWSKIQEFSISLEENTFRFTALDLPLEEQCELQGFSTAAPSLRATSGHRISALEEQWS